MTKKTNDNTFILLTADAVTKKLSALNNMRNNAVLYASSGLINFIVHGNTAQLDAVASFSRYLTQDEKAIIRLLINTIKPSKNQETKLYAGMELSPQSKIIRNAAKVAFESLVKDTDAVPNNIIDQINDKMGIEAPVKSVKGATSLSSILTGVEKMNGTQVVAVKDTDKMSIDARIASGMFSGMLDVHLSDLEKKSLQKLAGAYLKEVARLDKAVAGRKELAKGGNSRVA